MVKISVIVAVYAAEKYLRRCLDSLLNQSFSDFEVILIDDGSEDSSGKICDEYSFNDSRFKVVHKSNGGVSSARQLGLECAVGEYVIHVDPDDWTEPQMLQELYEFATKNSSDMVICDFYSEYLGKTVYESQQPTSLSHEKVFSDFFSKLHASCWNKLVKRNLFEMYSIRFPRQMVVWEDSFVNCLLAYQSIKIDYLPCAYYHYDRISNSNSLVSSVSIQKVDSMNFFIKYFSAYPNKALMDGLLAEKKVLAKRSAFLFKGMTLKKFKEMFPEIDERIFESKQKIDTLISFSLNKSWIIARFVLELWKLYFKLRKKLI